MTRTQLLAFAIGASLFFGFEPTTEAAPLSAPSIPVISSSDGPVVQVLTRAGVAHRSARRTARRVHRRHHL